MSSHQCFCSTGALFTNFSQVVQGSFHLVVTAIGWSNIEITTWISNFIHSNSEVQFNHWCLNFNSGLTKQPLKLGYWWVIASYKYNWCNYLSMSKSKLIPSSKSAPGTAFEQKCPHQNAGHFWCLGLSKTTLPIMIVISMTWGCLVYQRSGVGVLWSWMHHNQCFCFF